jgi:hypothetical protein
MRPNRSTAESRAGAQQIATPRKVSRGAGAFATLQQISQIISV